MSLPGYAEYKDSGVAWLGKIPAHWETRWLGSIASDQGSVFIDGDWIESKDISDEGYKYLTSGNVGEGFYKEQGLGFVSEKTFAELNCTEVLPGDILISRLNLPIARACIVPDFGCRIVTCVDNVIVRPNPNFERQYVIFMMSSKQHFANMENLARGTTMQRISRSTLSRVRFAFPPPQEQTAIATFLDRETAKIDELIAEQEKLIALLAEKRQATISHAVTKGLNPAATMKDSGVAWLGEVPAHWEISRLKFVASVQTGIAKGKDNSGKKTIEVSYLRVANVQDGYLALDDIAKIEIPADELPRYRLRPGDVLMNEGGDFDKLGRGHLWNGEIEDCIHQNHVFAVRPNAISSEWLNRVTSSNAAQFYFMSRSKQSTNLASISSTNVMELPLPLPPNEEQAVIVSFLDTETTRLDTLTAEATRGISLLKERRSALISAAVTGKIDVRHLAEAEAA